METNERKYGRDRKHVFKIPKNDLVGSKLKAERLKTTLQKLKDGERRSKVRNETLLQDFDSVNKHADNLDAKARKLKKVKQDYEAYINTIYPHWKENMEISRLASVRTPEEFNGSIFPDEVYKKTEQQAKAFGNAAPLHSTMNENEHYSLKTSMHVSPRFDPINSGWHTRYDSRDHEPEYAWKRDFSHSEIPRRSSNHERNWEDLERERIPRLNVESSFNRRASPSRNSRLNERSPRSVRYDGVTSTLVDHDHAGSTNPTRPNFLNLPRVDQNADISSFTIIPQALALSPDGQLVLLPMAFSPRMQTVDNTRFAPTDISQRDVDNLGGSTSVLSQQDNARRVENASYKSSDDRPTKTDGNFTYTTREMDISTVSDSVRQKRSPELNSVIYGNNRIGQERNDYMPGDQLVDRGSSRSKPQNNSATDEVLQSFERNSPSPEESNSIEKRKISSLEDRLDQRTPSRERNKLAGNSHEFQIIEKPNRRKEIEDVNASDIISVDDEVKNDLEDVLIKNMSVMENRKENESISFEDLEGSERDNQHRGEKHPKEHQTLGLSFSTENTNVDSKIESVIGKDDGSRGIFDVNGNNGVTDYPYVISPAKENAILSAPDIVNEKETDIISENVLEAERLPDFVDDLLSKDTEQRVSQPKEEIVGKEKDGINATTEASSVEPKLKMEPTSSSNVVDIVKKTKAVDMPEISFLYEEIENRMGFADKKDFYRASPETISQDVLLQIRRLLLVEGDLSSFKTADLCIVSRMLTSEFVQNNSSDCCIIKDSLDLSAVYTLNGFREIVLPAFEELWEYIFNHVELLYGNMIFESTAVCEIFSQILCSGNSNTAFEVSKAMQRIMDGEEEDFYDESGNESVQDVESVASYSKNKMNDLQENEVMDSHPVAVDGTILTKGQDIIDESRMVRSPDGQDEEHAVRSNEASTRSNENSTRSNENSTRSNENSTRSNENSTRSKDNSTRSNEYSTRSNENSAQSKEAKVMSKDTGTLSSKRNDQRVSSPNMKEAKENDIQSNKANDRTKEKDLADLSLDLGSISDDDDNDSSTFDSTKLTPRRKPEIAAANNDEENVTIASSDSETSSAEIPTDVGTRDKEVAKTIIIEEDIDEDSESGDDLEDILSASLGRNKIENENVKEDAEAPVPKTDGVKSRALFKNKQDSFEIDEMRPETKFSVNSARSGAFSPENSKSISSKFRKPGFWENSDSESDAEENISGGNNLSEKNEDDNEFDFGFYT